MVNKKRIKKKEEKGDRLVKDFIAFGNRKRVFWSITLSTILLSLIGIPIMIDSQKMFKYFIIIWILEAIYIKLYLTTRNKK